MIRMTVLEHTATTRNPVDFLIVAALQEEFTALRRIFRTEKIAKDQWDANQYYAAAVTNYVGGKYRLRIFCAHGKGGARMAARITWAIARWRPRHVVLVGIAATLPGGNIRLGDVLVADRIVDLSEEKTFPKHATFRARIVDCDEELVGSAAEFADDSTKTRIFLGPIISQSDLIKSAARRRQLAAYVINALDHPAIGIEMEGGGLAAAAAVADAAKRPGILVIKGAVDYANYHKGDLKRKKAATNAARVLKHWLQAGPIQAADKGALPAAAPSGRHHRIECPPTIDEILDEIESRRRGKAPASAQMARRLRNSLESMNPPDRLPAMQPTALDSVVFRVVKQRHAADVSGAGARLYPGRWHDIGMRALYFAFSEDDALRAAASSVIRKADAEAKAPLPGYLVARFDLKLGHALDLSPKLLGQRFIDAKDVDLTRRWSRLALEAGYEALLVPAVPDRPRMVVVFPDNLNPRSTVRLVVTDDPNPDAA
jgi:nucleoside phosphorylase/RES domain-containing protein